MVSLSDVPIGLEAIIRRYGNPDRDGNAVMDDSFADHHLRVYDLPYKLRLAWRPGQIVTRFRAHMDVAPVIVDALKEIGEYKGLSYLEKNKLNYWGGCWWFRLKRASSEELSTHSWGIALDLNPHIAPMGERDHKQPVFIVDAFLKRGFCWGGNWLYPDAMHFQACGGY